MPVYSLDGEKNIPTRFAVVLDTVVFLTLGVDWHGSTP